MPRRGILDPEYVYMPWTEERRARRSEEARREYYLKKMAKVVRVTRTVGPAVERAPAKAIVIARKYPTPKREWSAPLLKEVALIRRTRSWEGSEVLFLDPEDEDFWLVDPLTLCGIHDGLDLYEFPHPHKLTPGWYFIEQVGDLEIRVMPMEIGPDDYCAAAFVPQPR